MSEGGKNHDNLPPSAFRLPPCRNGHRPLRGAHVSRFAKIAISSSGARHSSRTAGPSRESASQPDAGGCRRSRLGRFCARKHQFAGSPCLAGRNRPICSSFATTGKFCRGKLSRCRAWAESICTPRCCQNIAGLADQLGHLSRRNGNRRDGNPHDAATRAGPSLVQRSTPIAPDETAPQLEARLAQLGVDAVIDAIVLLAAGKSARALCRSSGGHKSAAAKKTRRTNRLVASRRGNLQSNPRVPAVAEKLHVSQTRRFAGNAAHRGTRTTPRRGHCIVDRLFPVTPLAKSSPPKATT